MRLHGSWNCRCTWLQSWEKILIRRRVHAIICYSFEWGSSKDWIFKRFSNVFVDNLVPSKWFLFIVYPFSQKRFLWPLCSALSTRLIIWWMWCECIQWAKIVARQWKLAAQRFPFIEMRAFKNIICLHFTFTYASIIASRNNNTKRKKRRLVCNKYFLVRLYICMQRSTM